MEFLKFTFCLLLIMATAMMMTFSARVPRRYKIVFQDSAEMVTQRVDVRLRRIRKAHIEGREFEEGLPGVYPLGGPPQRSYVLSTTVQPVPQEIPDAELWRPNLIYQPARLPTTNYPGKQYSNNPFLKNVQATTKSDAYSNGSNLVEEETNREGKSEVWRPNLIYQPARLPTTNYPGKQYSNNPFLKNVQATTKSDAYSNGSNLLEEETNREGKSEVWRPNLIYQPARLPTTNYPGNQYSNNPFLKNVQAITKSDAYSNGGPITNRLPTADQPSTTTPSCQNPRRTDLLYGSNLLEEETNREGKSSNPEDIEFGNRGLFNTTKHCPSGQILVNDRCRMSV